MLPLLAASALLVAPVVLADAHGDGENGVNSIKCTAIAIGDTSTYSRDAFVDLGVEFAAQVCGDGEGYAGIDVTYEKIAVAIAKAVATTYVECVTEGKSVYGEAEAYSHAKTSTGAYAEALGTGWASIETCYGCKAGAELFVASSKEIFASAMAESRSELQAYGEKTGAAKFMAAGSVVKSIEAVVARTYANVAIEVQAAVDQEEGTQSCGVKVQGCTKAGDESGCCELTVDNAAAQVSTVAISEAASGAEAIAYTCGEQYSEAESIAYAKAIAYAFASAVSSADGYCYSTDRSSACAWAGGSVSAFAFAQATAFAEAWAEAGNGCSCNIAVATVAESFQKIFLEAHSSLEAEICVEGTGLAGIEILQKAYAEVTITAIADALATAWQDSESCGATAFACAETGSAYQLDYACCDVSADNYPVDLSKDGYAEAVAYAGTFSCATEADAIEAASNVFVKATAQAIAKAVIEVDEFCVSTERAGFCSFIEGSITAHASAQAKAFAEAWAGTPFDCDCIVEAASVATSVKTVFTQVTTRVHREMCKYGEAFEYTSEQIYEVAKQETTALAAAFAEVISNGKNCQAKVGVDTDINDDPDATLPDPPVTDKDEVCDNCVGAHETCWTKGSDVLGCCDPAFVCITRSPSRASCKKPGSPAAARYERFGHGEIKECPKK